MSDYDSNIPVNPPFHRHDSPPPVPPKRTSFKAILALVLGGASFVFWIFTALPAIVLGALAKQDIKRDPRLTGDGMATVGLTLGCVSLIFAPLVLVLLLPFLLFSAPAELPPSEGDRIVHLHLRGSLTETAPGDPFALLAEAPPTLRSVIGKLEKARTDDSVKAVLITLDGLSVGFADGEELHKAFRSLDAEGKKVFVHTEEVFLSTGTYALLTGATTINAVPTAFIDLTGIYMEGLFLKDGLDKLGLRADIVHMGDYKSAGEIATRSDPSPEAAEAMNWLLDSLYESNVARIATVRNTTPDEVKARIDGGPYTMERALEIGLVDSVMHRDDFLAAVKDEYGTDIYIDNHYGDPPAPDIDFNSPLAPLEILFADFEEYPEIKVGESIAIVSVEGNIVPGYSDPAAMGEAGAAYSGDIRDALEQAENDDTVKAVVLRVNSPGGSATASEIILRAAMKLKARKPVVVSMGDLAASGGYYVSCDADAIFANETTITASIGVVGGKIVTTGLWDKLGVNWHAYQRGADADWMSTAQPFSDTQREKVLEYMDDTYRTFKDHVVRGRGDKLSEPIDAMAGGRVFTGKQALDLGLVDEIGGLQDAIAYAAALVELEEYDVRPLPDLQYLDEILVNFLFGGGERPSDLSLGDPPNTYGDAVRTPHWGSSALDPTGLRSLVGTLDPQRSARAMEFLQCAELLNREGVLTITPLFFSTK